MRRLDTHDSEELHVKPGVVPTVLIITVAEIYADAFRVFFSITQDKIHEPHLESY